ncbi:MULTISPECIES: glucuronate isomerase [unclassified Robiginitalea]|uniref:glucuronate isomerase n=1 Tax=Robiginitalea TaxID=252306 RepID=UPI00234998A1|nr:MULTISPECIES: glucuronate isomerase [unclassified Robiginitalea]MDC6354367.1 glucuronate isomerase [Robiginitalea sp. PM2]MDC6374951.1 glucuronate isomerase [Robiginitalea sp. SP8]
MTFIREDFLLESPQARTLYFDYAADLPIIDYHNHLSPRQIATDHNFENSTQAWLSGDHYKWRAMRTLGIGEEYITGDAPDEEKFMKWAWAVPQTVRNPLYHWTHLELQRYFGITDLLDERNARDIYEQTSLQLRQPSHSARGLLGRMRVEVVCTTDDPVDSLEFHRQAQSLKTGPRLLPAFRPDAAYSIGDPKAYSRYLDRLETAAGMSIRNYADLLQALDARLAYFHKQGCRIADHGLGQLAFFATPYCDIEKLFRDVQAGRVPEPQEMRYFEFATLSHLCRQYHSRGWVQQFHLGALRDTNTRMRETLGPDTGFDSIGDFPQARGLAGFLDHLDRSDQLAKTILYNLNPSWNEVFATMAGNFNDGSIRGKIQFGSGWWYNDQLQGMERQLDALSNMGLLSCFVGMLTDSRSLLSFPRHEYFRRLLCNLLGADIERGRLPDDTDFLGKIVRDICYFNAKAYFDF